MNNVHTNSRLCNMNCSINGSSKNVLSAHCRTIVVYSECHSDIHGWSTAPKMAVIFLVSRQHNPVVSISR